MSRLKTQSDAGKDIFCFTFYSPLFLIAFVKTILLTEVSQRVGIFWPHRYKKTLN